ncbi:MAG TPA: hypothetical protein VK493_03120 [Bryobacteraceae bacterium]|nr:hypothetical protein [Bryobacteraceae bacterium]
MAGSACLSLFAQSPKPESVNDVLAAYTGALGGAAAIDRIATREVRGTVGLHAHVTYYWQKPNKVLRLSKRDRIGFDGSGGWITERRGRIRRLGRDAGKRLEADANPLRYVHLREMYSELGPGPPETVDARAMHLIVAPNNLGTTKFYFDAGTHLLRRIEETGETSAYFKTSTDFLNYKTVNAVQFPFRIVHSTTEPGGAKEDLRVSKVIENEPVNAAAFSNPRADPKGR